MEKFRTLRTITITAISLLYVLLFVYAAMSKLFDYENFKVQLGQSPLLSPMAGSVSIAVPVAELLIAAALLVPFFRYAGLLAGFGMMTMFTAYIYIILNYSEFVPCSCGGILEKMGWQEHLAFNIVFVFLAALAVLIYPQQKKIKES